MGIDPELFFPSAEPGSDPYNQQVKQAKSVCWSCPLRAACLEENLLEPAGIFGGYDEPERRRLAQDGKRAVISAPAARRVPRAWPEPVMVERLIHQASGAATRSTKGASGADRAAAALELIGRGTAPTTAAKNLRVNACTVRAWTADEAAS